MKEAIAYIDGSGNSERVQACATVLQYAGKVYRRTQLLPGGTTNNVGEYSGLILAIRLAKELGVEALRIRSDSKLIVEQVNGRWKCKDDRLRQLRHLVWREAQAFHSIEIVWIPREENIEADALCRQVIAASGQANSQPKPNPFFRPRSHSLDVDIV
jgi:ribonuclease HI